LESKEILVIQRIITLLEEENSEEAQVELKKFVVDFEKVHKDLGRLCELFRNYVYDYKTHQRFLKESSLKTLILNIDQISEFLATGKNQKLEEMLVALEKKKEKDHA